jgi:hypothetical protein
VVRISWNIVGRFFKIKYKFTFRPVCLLFGFRNCNSLENYLFTFFSFTLGLNFKEKKNETGKKKKKENERTGCFLFFRPIVKIYRPGGGNPSSISVKKKLFFFFYLLPIVFFLKKNIIIYFYFLKLPCLRVCSRAWYITRAHDRLRLRRRTATDWVKLFFFYPDDDPRRNDMRSFISTHENLNNILFYFYSNKRKY